MSDQQDFQRFARKLGLVGGIALAIWLAILLKDVVILFLGGVVLAAALAPVIDRAEARGVPRGVTVLLVVALLLGLFVLFLLEVLPILISQGTTLVKSLPDMVATLPARMPSMRFLMPAMPNASSLGNALQFGITQGLAIALRAANSLGNLTLVGLITIMLTMDAPGIKVAVLRLLPPKQGEALAPYLPEMSAKLAGYVTGTGLSCAILAGASMAILKLLGVPYALLLSVTLGIIAILPIVGGLLGILPASLVAFFISPVRGLWAFVALFALVQVVANFISPIIMQRTISIHPLVVLFAVTFGWRVGGLGGAIVAVPLAAALQVLIEHLYIQPRHPEP